MERTRRNVPVFLVLLTLLLIGCGPAKPKLVPVAGTVTLDGKPLPLGSIQFITENQRPAYANIEPDGSFRLQTDDEEGCPAGRYKVVVQAQEAIGTEATGESTRQLTPPRYASLELTDLVVTIEGPQEDLKIELTTRPRS